MFARATLIPAIGFALSLIPMLFYDYTGKRKEAILAELEERRAAKRAAAEAAALAAAEEGVSPVRVTEEEAEPSLTESVFTSEAVTLSGKEADGEKTPDGTAAE